MKLYHLAPPSLAWNDSGSPVFTDKPTLLGARMLPAVSHLGRDRSRGEFWGDFVASSPTGRKN
jgi:hypothetical protein